MELMKSNVIVMKIKNANQEYTCIFDSGDDLYKEWLQLKVIEPSARNKHLKIAHYEPKVDLTVVVKNRSFEESFKNLKRYKEIKNIVAFKPYWSSVGAYKDAKYLVVSNLVSCNDSRVKSFDNFMLLCTLHCYLTVTKKYFCFKTMDYRENNELATKKLMDCYFNPIAVDFGIPVDEHIHWLIVPQFELLFHIYPCEILAIAAYFSIKSNYSKKIAEQFGDVLQIKANIKKLQTSYKLDQRSEIVCLGKVADYYSILKKHLPLCDLDSNEPIGDTFLDDNLNRYMDNIFNHKESDSVNDIQDGSINDFKVLYEYLFS